MNQCDILRRVRLIEQRIRDRRRPCSIASDAELEHPKITPVDV